VFWKQRCTVRKFALADGAVPTEAKSLGLISTGFRLLGQL